MQFVVRAPWFACAVLASAAAAVILPQTVRADLLAYEPFDYAGGASLNGANGGTGWSDAWLDADNDTTLGSTASSLAYPAASTLTSAGNRVALTAADDSAGAQRTLTGASDVELGTNGQTYYSSALFRRSATIGESTLVHFRGLSSGTFVGRWTYGINAAGQFTVSVNPDPMQNQVATSTALAEPDTTYLLVAKIRTNTGTGTPLEDEVFLKFYGPGDAITGEPATDAAWDLREQGNSGLTLNQVLLSMSHDGIGSNQFDEFRLGTSFADVTGVVPEPATATLLGLGACGALLRRRRRSA
jgi:hypothetical protein